MGTVVIGPVGKYFGKGKVKETWGGEVIGVGRVEHCIPSLIALI